MAILGQKEQSRLRGTSFPTPGKYRNYNILDCSLISLNIQRVLNMTWRLETRVIMYFPCTLSPAVDPWWKIARMNDLKVKTPGFKINTALLPCVCNCNSLRWKKTCNTVAVTFDIYRNTQVNPKNSCVSLYAWTVRKKR